MPSILHFEVEVYDNSSRRISRPKCSSCGELPSRFYMLERIPFLSVGSSIYDGLGSLTRNLLADVILQAFRRRIMRHENREGTPRDELHLAWSKYVAFSKPE